MVQKFHAHCAATGRVGLPAIPSLLDDYMALIDNLLTGACRRWGPSRDELRARLKKTLDEAFAASPRSMLILDWSTRADQLNIETQVQTLADNYDRWIDGRGEAPFGTHADARIWLLAEELTGGNGTAACWTSAPGPAATRSRWPGTATRPTRSSCPRNSPSRCATPPPP
jgi:hypothetical protein